MDTPLPPPVMAGGAIEVIVGTETRMDYQIKPLGKTCSQTGRELVPGDVCYSALFAKNDDWVRVDYSREGWTGPPPEALGYWRCTVPPQGDAARRTLDPDALLSQFERLCEEANPAAEKLRYVLALFLVQRRRLRVTGQRTDGEGSLLEFSGMQGEGPFEVREQQLDEQEIESLQRELNDRLTVESK